MVRIRSGWLVALVALGLGASACKKNDSNKKSGTADKATEGAPAAGGDKASPPAAGGAALTGQAGDDLSLLPVDSDAVFGLNFAQLRASALWKEFVEPKLATSNIAGIQKFKALCGFDPFESLQSVAVGIKNIGPGTEPSGAVAIHGYDKAKAMTCFDKDGVAEVEKDGAKVTIDGDVAMITDNGHQYGFTFVNDTTALLVFGPDAATKDGIKKVAAGNSGLKTSQTVVELYSKIKTSDSMWMLVNGNAPFMRSAGSMGIKPKAVFGSVNVTDGLSVDLHIRLGSNDEANNLVTMAKGELDQAKQFFDKIDVSNDGPDVKFDIAMSKEKLKQLAGMFGPMIGAALSGGMGAGGMGGGLGGP